MNYAIVLAGGVGTRFWPLSRKAVPKQFFALTSEKPMIAETIERVSGLINVKQVYVAANKAHTVQVKNALKSFGLPAGNIFFEPEGRNTLAPIAYLSKIIYESDPDAVVIVLPSDHFIRDKKSFIFYLKEALKAARKGYIVTLGIPPKNPHTGYGYIKATSKRVTPKAWRIERFVEKPDVRRARLFLKNKKYFWNNGIFIFKPVILLRELKRLEPDAFEILMCMNKDTVNMLWRALPDTSIDYGVMEKALDCAVVPSEYGWNDIGSWEALEEILKKDAAGNISKGPCLNIGSKNCVSWSTGRLIATVGLKNMIVVETKDALLVCPKSKSQDIKQVVALLKSKNFPKQL